MPRIPVFAVHVPEYVVSSKPDYSKIGQRIDQLIKAHFLGKKVAIRCLGSEEHPGKSASELIAIIRELGTDRYDPSRKGDRYDNVQHRQIDFFALDFKVSNQTKMMEQFIESFYLYPPMIRGVKPIRLDIVIIYDLAKLRRIWHSYEGRKDRKRDGFVFKDPHNRSDAILGIIHIQ